MSAPVLHLLAFSEPVVNSGEVSFRANFGNQVLVIAGAPSLLAKLGVALAGAQKPQDIAGRDLAQARGPKVPEERQRAYHEIDRIARSNPPHGAIKAACIARGIKPSAFATWQKRRAPITS